MNGKNLPAAELRAPERTPALAVREGYLDDDQVAHVVGGAGNDMPWQRLFSGRSVNVQPR